MAYAGIRVSSSTTSSPAPGLEERSGGYHFQRDPTWTPNDPRYREPPPPTPPATVAKAAARAARVREFARHRKDGLSILAAGRKVGITSKTAYAYERDSKALGEAQAS